jgi:hypothetical protein
MLFVLFYFLLQGTSALTKTFVNTANTFCLSRSSFAPQTYLFCRIFPNKNKFLFGKNMDIYCLGGYEGATWGVLVV